VNTDDGNHLLRNRKHDLNLNLERKKILIDLLKPFVLRRLKRDVLVDLPKKSEVMIFHDLSKIQKDLYKAILTKNRCKRSPKCK